MLFYKRLCESLVSFAFTLLVNLVDLKLWRNYAIFFSIALYVYSVKNQTRNNKPPYEELPTYPIFLAGAIIGRLGSYTLMERILFNQFLVLMLIWTDLLDLVKEWDTNEYFRDLFQRQQQNAAQLGCPGH